MPKLPDDPKELASALEVSIPYAYALLGTKRPWTQPLAIRAFRKLGVKVGPIENATDEEIDVLERYAAQAA